MGGENGDTTITHLVEPRRCRRAAHAVAVDEHDTPVARGDVPVGRLEKLAANDLTGTGPGSRPMLVGRTQIKDEKTMGRSLVLPATER